MFDFTNMNHQLHHGDCLEVLSTMPDNSVDSIVTDPPYGLSFMGKKWDYDVPSEDIWRECLRVLKPGGHLLAFAGTRTQHRMAVRIEDAGFEIRDMIAWVYASGFPKSLDVSKAIDKAAGADREKVPATGGLHKNNNLNDDGWSKIGEEKPTMDSAFPATEAAKQWQGWGTALKPALEPITVARKPLGEKTVAANVLAHGTGAINVDGCRVESSHKDKEVMDGKASRNPTGKTAANVPFVPGVCQLSNPAGRWPANLIHDGSDEVVGLFPVTTSGGGDKHGRKASSFCASTDWEAFKGTSSGGDTGSAARFFYCAKASKKDRDEGCEGLPVKRCSDGRASGLSSGMPEKALAAARNHHPTVKPTDLMRYLCRLVTPPGGIVLDPFMGSGSTGKAAMLEGFHFIGIERDADYIEIAKSRITAS